MFIDTISIGVGRKIPECPDERWKIKMIKQYSFDTYSEQMAWNALLHVIRSVSVYWSFKISIVALSCTKQKLHTHSRTRTYIGTDPFIKKILHAVQFWSLCRHDAVQSSYDVDCGCTCAYVLEDWVYVAVAADAITITIMLCERCVWVCVCVFLLKLSVSVGFSFTFQVYAQIA